MCVHWSAWRRFQLQAGRAAAAAAACLSPWRSARIHLEADRKGKAGLERHTQMQRDEHGETAFRTTAAAATAERDSDTTTQRVSCHH